jgi:hypothetical protein
MGSCPSVEQGKNFDWDAQRRVYNLSPLEMLDMYVEAVKVCILELHKNPEKMADAKTADTMAKHASVIDRLDVRKKVQRCGT